MASRFLFGIPRPLFRKLRILFSRFSWCLDWNIVMQYKNKHTEGPLENKFEVNMGDSDSIIGVYEYMHIWGNRQLTTVHCQYKRQIENRAIRGATWTLNPGPYTTLGR